MRPNWRAVAKRYRSGQQGRKRCVECGKAITPTGGVEWDAGHWTCEGDCTAAVEDRVSSSDDWVNGALRDAHDEGAAKGYREAELDFREHW
jgi:hypothetical protein